MDSTWLVGEVQSATLHGVYFFSIWKLTLITLVSGLYAAIEREEKEEEREREWEILIIIQ